MRCGWLNRSEPRLRVIFRKFSTIMLIFCGMFVIQLRQSPLRPSHFLPDFFKNFVTIKDLLDELAIVERLDGTRQAADHMEADRNHATKSSWWR